MDLAPSTAMRHASSKKEWQENQVRSVFVACARCASQLDTIPETVLAHADDLIE
jgi:hypothetical protein